MCGIFGIVQKSGAVSPKEMRALIHALYRYSESRGKEAAGAAFRFNGTIEVYKRAVPASEMIREKGYRQLLHRFLSAPDPVKAFIGHSRLVTNGNQSNAANNQPVSSEGITGVHNGIIVNHEALWQRHPALQRKYEVDTEVLFSLMGHHARVCGSLPEGTLKAFGAIQGNASIAAFSEFTPELMLSTNNGSLYIARSDDFLFFTSEKYIRDKVLTKVFRREPGSCSLFQLEPMQLLLVDLTTMKGQVAADGLSIQGHILNGKRIPVTDASPKGTPTPVIQTGSGPDYKSFDLYFEKLQKRVDSLRRCTCCLLPETMPFISFDANGVCNYCAHYSRIQVRGRDALFQTVEPFRKPGKQQDIVLGASGGRDSTYALHYAKEVLGLKPIAYTYDWGMVTDLARRNVARITGQLGIEHILISADINQKRRYIRKNVSAWLKQPHLGLVPLFMAGDKQYFYYLDQVMKQNKIDITLYAENQLEKTHFKTGFCNIEEGGGSIYYDISFFKKLQLPWFYLKNYAKNPAYFNESVWDTVGAFFSAYFIKHDYIFLYHYIPWNEEEINETLINLYDWELSPDTPTTWRIGDGTAAFYNYIYYGMAGITENDTLRSNQIREGHLSREEALRRVNLENRPRWESIRWYCDTIGIDMNEAIRRINQAPKVKLLQG